MMKATLTQFLANISLIDSLHPRYRLGNIGNNGYCDCIGLIMGALARCGVKWNGIHGSNYAARYRLTGGIKPISAVGILRVGMLVFKGKADTSDLPKRYHKGGALYNGDLHDYYHVGVVTSVNPLEITHMTSPTVKHDTSLGKWGYYGECSLVDYQSAEPTPIPTIDVYERVYAPTGKTVNLRKTASTKSSIILRVPIGDNVRLIDDGSGWDKVAYDGKIGYMMDKYLEEVKAA